MQTNITIDDSLIGEALKITGLKTEKDVIELGLKMLIKLKQQETIRAYRGQLRWEDDLDEMRTNR